MAARFFLLEAIGQEGGHHHEAKLVGVLNSLYELPLTLLSVEYLNGG
jgi:hypothetical protein